MIKLTYTDEMKEQDRLWENEQENIDTMKNLYQQILNEAKEHGFNGEYVIYEHQEAVIEVYANAEEKQRCDKGEIDSHNMFGYCKPLINHLESVLNCK